MPLVTDVAVKGALVAFARVLDDRAVIVVAPQLVAPLISNGHGAPLGGDEWKTSRVVLPPELAGLTFRHELTGAEVIPTSGDGAWLFAAQLFEAVPVAVPRPG